MDPHAALTGEQEQRRRDGLRILARIIARHYLQQPQRCAADDEGADTEELGRPAAPKSNDGPMPDAEDAR